MRLRATKDDSVVYDDGDYATNVQREDSSPPEKEKTKKKIALDVPPRIVISKASLQQAPSLQISTSLRIRWMIGIRPNGR